MHNLCDYQIGVVICDQMANRSDHSSTLLFHVRLMLQTFSAGGWGVQEVTFTRLHLPSARAPIHLVHSPLQA